MHHKKFQLKMRKNSSKQKNTIFVKIQYTEKDMSKRS